MKQRLNILQSKLSPPRIAHLLPRGRLTHRLGQIVRKRLALVVAGAGYGKTTLVTQAVGDINCPLIWYSLDETDRDFSTFLAYLAAGMHAHAPGFGSGLRRRLEAAASGEKWRQAILLEFLETFETRISGDVVVVLDDFHTVDPSRDVAEAVSFLLARCPRNLHWVLVSRTDPPLKLSRYRAMDDVVDLAEADLAFQREEIDGLYRGLLHVDMGEADIEKVVEKTGGWAVGLVLLFHALSGASTAGEKEALFEIGRSRALVFQYLEENIFDHQPESTRTFMLRSSLLARIDPEFCDTVFDTQNALEILDRLCRNHLLTFPDGQTGRSYRYHHLFQDYLRDKLSRTHGTAEVKRLHGQIGAAMERGGNTHGALRHYLAGSHFDEISRIFEKMVFADFMDCPFRFFFDLFEEIPTPVLNQNPKMLYLAAKLTAMGGDIAGSLEGFQTALSRFQALGDATGILTCQKELGMHYYLTGDMPRAMGQMEPLWGQQHDDAFFPAEIAGYLVLFATLVGDLDKADDYFQRAQGVTGLSKMERGLANAYLGLCYAYRFHTSGDFAKADRLNRNSLETLKDLEMEPILPLIHFQTALTLFFMGEPEDGSAHADQGIVLAERMGIYNAQYAWLLYGKALNLMGRGDSEGAEAYALEAMAFFEAQQHGWGQAAALELLGMMRREKKAPTEALRLFEKALAAIAAMDFPSARASIALAMAETLVDEGRDGEAETLIGTYAQSIRISRFNRFRKDLVLARIHWNGGDSKKAPERLTAALSAAEDHRYGFWVLRELAGIVQPLLACHAAGSKADFIEKILNHGGAGVREVVVALKHTPGHQGDRLLATLAFDEAPPLEVQCLGSFTVCVGGRPIPPEAWKNSKAKKLFQYLAMNCGKGYVPKDVLLEFAWPGEEVAKTNRRFHVAMTFLRKLLEPELKRGIPSVYLLRRDAGYRLDTGRQGRIDFIDFLSAADKGRMMESVEKAGAIDSYREAESLYAGTLFPEDPYEDIFSGKREALQEKYLMVLRKLMDHELRQENWECCTAYAEKYIVTDPYAENAYGILMKCCAAAGDISRLKRVYDRCNGLLARDLGLPLQPQTEALYQRLIARGNC